MLLQHNLASPDLQPARSIALVMRIQHFWSPGRIYRPQGLAVKEYFGKNQGKPRKLRIQDIHKNWLEIGLPWWSSG